MGLVWVFLSLLSACYAATDSFPCMCEFQSDDCANTFQQEFNEMVGLQNDNATCSSHGFYLKDFCAPENDGLDLSHCSGIDNELECETHSFDQHACKYSWETEQKCMTADQEDDCPDSSYRDSGNCSDFVYTGAKTSKCRWEHVDRRIESADCCVGSFDCMCPDDSTFLPDNNIDGLSCAKKFFSYSPGVDTCEERRSRIMDAKLDFAASCCSVPSVASTEFDCLCSGFNNSGHCPIKAASFINYFRERLFSDANNLPDVCSSDFVRPEGICRTTEPTANPRACDHHSAENCSSATYTSQSSCSPQDRTCEPYWDYGVKMTDEHVSGCRLRSSHWNLHKDNSSVCDNVIASGETLTRSDCQNTGYMFCGHSSGELCDFDFQFRASGNESANQLCHAVASEREVHCNFQTDIEVDMDYIEDCCGETDVQDLECLCGAGSSLKTDSVFCTSEEDLSRDSEFQSGDVLSSATGDLDTCSSNCSMTPACLSYFFEIKSSKCTMLRMDFATAKMSSFFTSYFDQNNPPENVGVLGKPCEEEDSMSSSDIPQCLQNCSAQCGDNDCQCLQDNCGDPESEDHLCNSTVGTAWAAAKYLDNGCSLHHREFIPSSCLDVCWNGCQKDDCGCIKNNCNPDTLRDSLSCTEEANLEFFLTWLNRDCNSYTVKNAPDTNTHTCVDELDSRTFALFEDNTCSARKDRFFGQGNDNDKRKIISKCCTVPADHNMNCMCPGGAKFSPSAVLLGGATCGGFVQENLQRAILRAGADVGNETCRELVEAAQSGSCRSDNSDWSTTACEGIGTKEECENTSYMSTSYSTCNYDLLFCQNADSSCSIPKQFWDAQTMIDGFTKDACAIDCEGDWCGCSDYAYGSMCVLHGQPCPGYNGTTACGDISFVETYTQKCSWESESEIISDKPLLESCCDMSAVNATELPLGKLCPHPRALFNKEDEQCVEDGTKLILSSKLSGISHDNIREVLAHRHDHNVNMLRERCCTGVETGAFDCMCPGKKFASNATCTMNAYDNLHGHNKNKKCGDLKGEIHCHAIHTYHDNDDIRHECEAQTMEECSTHHTNISTKLFCRLESDQCHTEDGMCVSHQEGTRVECPKPEWGAACHERRLNARCVDHMGNQCPSYNGTDESACDSAVIEEAVPTGPVCNLRHEESAWWALQDTIMECCSVDEGEDDEKFKCAVCPSPNMKFAGDNHVHGSTCRRMAFEKLFPVSDKACKVQKKWLMSHDSREMVNRCCEAPSSGVCLPNRDFGGPSDGTCISKDTLKGCISTEYTADIGCHVLDIWCEWRDDTCVFPEWAAGLAAVADHCSSKTSPDECRGSNRVCASNMGDDNGYKLCEPFDYEKMLAGDAYDRECRSMATLGTVKCQWKQKTTADNDTPKKDHKCPLLKGDTFMSDLPDSLKQALQGESCKELKIEARVDACDDDGKDCIGSIRLRGDENREMGLSFREVGLSKQRNRYYIEAEIRSEMGEKRYLIGDEKCQARDGRECVKVAAVSFEQSISTIAKNCMAACPGLRPEPQDMSGGSTLHFDMDFACVDDKCKQLVLVKDREEFGNLKPGCKKIAKKAEIDYHLGRCDVEDGEQRCKKVCIDAMKSYYECSPKYTKEVLQMLASCDIYPTIKNACRNLSGEFEGLVERYMKKNNKNCQKEDEEGPPCECIKFAADEGKFVKAVGGAACTIPEDGQAGPTLGVVLEQCGVDGFGLKSACPALVEMCPPKDKKKCENFEEIAQASVDKTCNEWSANGFDNDCFGMLLNDPKITFELSRNCADCESIPAQTCLTRCSVCVLDESAQQDANGGDCETCNTCLPYIGCIEDLPSCSACSEKIECGKGEIDIPLQCQQCKKSLQKYCATSGEREKAKQKAAALKDAAKEVANALKDCKPTDDKCAENAEATMIEKITQASGKSKQQAKAQIEAIKKNQAKDKVATAHKGCSKSKADCEKEFVAKLKEAGVSESKAKVVLKEVKQNELKDDFTACLAKGKTNTICMKEAAGGVSVDSKILAQAKRQIGKAATAKAAKDLLACTKDDCTKDAQEAIEQTLSDKIPMAQKKKMAETKLKQGIAAAVGDEMKTCIKAAGNDVASKKLCRQEAQAQAVAAKMTAAEVKIYLARSKIEALVAPYEVCIEDGGTAETCTAEAKATFLETGTEAEWEQKKAQFDKLVALIGKSVVLKTLLKVDFSVTAEGATVAEMEAKLDAIKTNFQKFDTGVCTGDAASKITFNKPYENLFGEVELSGVASCSSTGCCSAFTEKVNTEGTDEVAKAFESTSRRLLASLTFTVGGEVATEPVDEETYIAEVEAEEIADIAASACLSTVANCTTATILTADCITSANSLKETCECLPKMAECIKVNDDCKATVAQYADRQEVLQCVAELTFKFSAAVTPTPSGLLLGLALAFFILEC